MEGSPEKPRADRLSVAIGCGYVFLCLLFVSTTAVAVLLGLGWKPPGWAGSGLVSAPEFGTLTLPALTPSAHISGSLPSTAVQIFSDDFTDNRSVWVDTSSWTGNGSIEQIADGRLTLESAASGQYASISCEPCAAPRAPYFLTAVLGTAQAADHNFGIMFGKGDNPFDFFTFEINTVRQRYYVSRLGSDIWLLRTSGDSSLIHPYPATNTLALYVNGDLAEFYINGSIVDSYIEPGTQFEDGAVGLWVDEPGFQLVASAMQLYKVGSQ